MKINIKYLFYALAAVLFLTLFYNILSRPSEPDLKSNTVFFGGTGNDEFNSIAKTGGGGYILAGSTGSFGAGKMDVYLVKPTQTVKSYGIKHSEARAMTSVMQSGRQRMAGT